MNRNVKKFVITRLSGEKLSKSALKYFVGGYDLPEVVITCGYSQGACWYSCADADTHCCLSGYTTDSCYIG